LKKPLLATAIGLALVGQAFAAEIPPYNPREFPWPMRGQWTRLDNESGFNIGKDTTFEAGYGCHLIKYKMVKDIVNPDEGVMQVDMSCQSDGMDPDPPEKVHQIWAYRNHQLIIAENDSVRLYKMGDR
jgi:hypothetical protein